MSDIKAGDQARLESELEVVENVLGHVDTPWIRPLHFSAPERLRIRDDSGPSAASYGIYNPVAAKVYLGLFGATPQAGAFPVPAESVLILPVRIPDYLDVGIDEGELGEGSATVYVMRFKTVQPFFLGGI